MTNWFIIGIVIACIVSLLAVFTVIYLIKKRYKIAIILAIAMIFLTLIVIFAIGVIAGKVASKLYTHALLSKIN
jgi:C4-dicarboxylate transporter